MYLKLSSFFLFVLSVTSEEWGNVDSLDRSMLRTEQSQGNNKYARLTRSVIIDAISVKQLIGHRNGVSVIKKSQEQPTLIFNHTSANVYNVEYHYKKGLVFFAALNKIYRGNITGRFSQMEDLKAIVESDVQGTTSLAVDWVSDRIYWMSNKHQTVEVADLDGYNRTLLIDNLQNTKYPNNIAVDPYEGFLFLVANHTVFRTGLDADKLTRLQLEKKEIRGIKCLALDFCKKRIYYSGKEGNPETGRPYIASCTYEGDNCQDLHYPLSWNDIFSLYVFRDTIYIAHYNSSDGDTIYKADLTSSQTVTPVLLHKFDEFLLSFKIFHPGVQKDPTMDNCRMPEAKTATSQAYKEP